jgi:hypothetical protein
MIDCLHLAARCLMSRFKSRARLEAENTVLRHQLNVLRRTASSRPRLTAIDRLLFVRLYRFFPSILSAMATVKPETVVRWHRRGFRCIGVGNHALGPADRGFRRKLEGWFER